MRLPRQASTAGAWYLHDFAQRALVTTADAAGAARLSLPDVPQDELWLIDRLVVSSTSAVMSEARVYLDNVDGLALVDGTRGGNLDIAEYPAALQVPGASVLVVQWTGATAGAQCVLRAQWRVMRRTEAY